MPPESSGGPPIHLALAQHLTYTAGHGPKDGVGTCGGPFANTGRPRAIHKGPWVRMKPADPKDSGRAGRDAKAKDSHNSPNHITFQGRPRHIDDTRGLFGGSREIKI